MEIAKRIHRDDRRPDGDRETLISWLREMRAGDRPFDAEQVRRRVRELAGAQLAYERLRIVFGDGEFAYEPIEGDDGS